MPSTSKKQHNLMAAVANNPAFAKKAGIPQRVGADFMKADTGRKFAKGGDMAKSNLFKGKETYGEELKEAKAIKSGKISPQQYAKGEKGEEAKMKRGGMTKKFAKGGCAKSYEEGGVTEGQNANIDDDTRARAMAAIRRRMAGEDDEALVAKPRAAAKSMPPKARESVASSPARKEEDKPKAPARYPTAAERGEQMRQSMADIEAENVRKRNKRAEEGKSSLNEMMSGLKRRFGTQAMREEGMKKGGKVQKFAKGGCIDGCATKGKTKGRYI